jgi:tetratricopeptide (TPR) repeat protein
LRDGKPISEELDAIKPDEPTPYQTGVSDYINLNATNGKIPNHLNFFSTRLLIKGQLCESSQTKASQSKKVEERSAGSTAQEFQLSSQTSQSDNPEPNVDSSTDGWHSFMNFMKPGMPLLLTLGFFGCLFGLSWLANWYGVTNHSARQLPKAQFGYSLALKLNPFSAAAHYNQAVTYEDQHNYQHAHAEYQMAIEGGLIEAYNNQARLYILEGNYDAAVSLLRSGLPMAKDDRVKADMHKNQGWARLEQGRYAEAKLDLAEAIKLKSESAPAYCLLAQVLEREEDKKAALEQWENCLGFAYQPNTPEEDQWIHLARQRLSAEGG